MKDYHGIEFKKWGRKAKQRTGKPHQNEMHRHDGTDKLESYKPEAIDQRVNAAMERFMK